MNLLNSILNDKKLILASGSPRRSFFLKELGLDFEIRLKDTEEIYSEHLKKEEISEYLSVQKAKPFKKELKENEILITADTIVWHDSIALGKPKNKEEAFQMLSSLSNKSHLVISSVAITTVRDQIILSDSTKVTFKKLNDKEINYYIDNYQPFDKAGAYGIQEWIGFIGVTEIQGSYFNVMGFPVQKFYETLRQL
ncbi:Maf-like protein [Lutimonas saemankumensis]|nr:Maf-like protein [Lutimonas saemankumensis]MCA0931973.1 Maf-like protein [Lutimonas saemankumensis]